MPDSANYDRLIVRTTHVNRRGRRPIFWRVCALLLTLLQSTACESNSSSSQAPTTSAQQSAAPRATEPAVATATSSANTAMPSELPATPTPREIATVEPTTTQAATVEPTAPPQVATATAPLSKATVEPEWSYPIGVEGRPPGDGFFIRHGYTVENTWFNPGYWHTGEDWYAIEGETAGASVYASADGTVVYNGANYPGRVVIVAHAGGLHSMYGHLDPALAVQTGQQVQRGSLLGTVLRRSDETPNHLHFEVRTFLTTAEVNGDQPRYGFRCGPNCPPGPGYWPLAAPELPSALGWRNPTHVIAGRAFSGGQEQALGEVVVAAQPISSSVTLWSELSDDGTPRGQVGELPMEPGARFSLIEIRAGPEDTQGASAQTYQLWYKIRIDDGRSGWAQAAVPTRFETGSDGMASTVRFNFFPAGTPAP